MESPPRVSHRFKCKTVAMPKVKTPHFPILDSTHCRLDSTFWLDSTLNLYCARRAMWQTDQVPGVKQLLHGLSLVQADANNQSALWGRPSVAQCHDWVRGPSKGLQTSGNFLGKWFKTSFPFSALTLLVGRQEGIRPVTGWVLVCWW